MSRSFDTTTVADLRALHRLEIDLERQYCEGPRSRWDGELLERWRADVRAQIMRVEIVLERQTDEPRTIRDRFAAALRREGVVHLNAGDIGSPTFDRVVEAMEQAPVLALLQPWS